VAEFDAPTGRAVAEFQAARGLHRSGICDEATWLALVEASWKLGDRWLKLSSPYIRGDDVGQLQTALLRLGFDCGRPDGIYGPLTVRAVQRFQRNSGMQSDGVCGPDTVRLLLMNSRQTGDGPGVAMLREMTGLSAVRHDGEDVRIVVGQFGGLSALTRQVSRALRQHAANVLTIDEPDPSVQAAVANRHRATAYLGFEASGNERCTVSYFAAPTFESVGGRALAHRPRSRRARRIGTPHQARSRLCPRTIPEIEGANRRQPRVPVRLVARQPLRARSPPRLRQRVDCRRRIGARLQARSVVGEYMADRVIGRPAAPELARFFGLAGRG